MRLALFWLLALPSVALAAGADGLYKPDAEWADHWDCETVGVDGGALAIRDGVFFGVESRCELTNPVNVRGMDATLFDEMCGGEGETWQSRLLIMDTPEGIITMRDGGDVMRLIRCN